jgi:NAD(P)-dependent dehydrogenase (short-subunit alcohol dehydrogenase family)
MDIGGRVAIVTGGGSGIGEGLCRAFIDAGARAVVVADIRETDADRVASDITAAGGRALAHTLDVGVEAEVTGLVRRTEETFGPVDVFVSNAGVAVLGGVEVPDEQWQHLWQVNVAAHIYAARAVLPGMLARGEGYLVHTASAAGLLTQLDSAPYSVTKHAAVALAEWLSITHGDSGVRVSCLCPQAVETGMTRRLIERQRQRGREPDGLLQPADVAQAVLAAMAAEEFLILPHPKTATYERRRAGDRDRWLAGMRALQAKMDARRRPRPTG